MTTPNTPNSRNALVLGVCVVFVATLAAVVALALGMKDTERVEGLVGIILPAAGTLVLAILALDRVQAVAERVQNVEQHTTDLTNGLLDAKVRAAVADVLAPELVDPTAEQLIDGDRRRRDTHNAAAHASDTPPGRA